MAKQIRSNQFTQVGKFVDAPIGYRVTTNKVGTSAWWSEMALQMVTHPEQLMHLYTYDPSREGGPKDAKKAREGALGCQHRIEHRGIISLNELTTDLMHFKAEITTRDNIVFHVYARYTRRSTV